MGNIDWDKLPLWVIILIVILWAVNKFVYPFYSKNAEITKKEFKECKDMLMKHEGIIADLKDKELELFGALEKLRGYLDAKLGKDYE